jgi:hypothetical protein
VDGPEDDLAEVERGVVAEPRVGADQALGRVADPPAPLAQPALDPAVQQLPQRGHADHAGDVPVLNGARQFFARQLGQVGDLRAARERGQKAGREFEGVV